MSELLTVLPSAKDPITNGKPFDGRLEIEKRLNLSVPVYLASWEDPAPVNERLRKTSVPTVPG